MTFRELRLRRGYTQPELADEAGCKQVTISQIELGKVRQPRYSTLIGLAKALDVTVDAVARAIRNTPKAEAA